MAHVDVEAGVAAVPAAHASCAGEGESEDTVHCCLPVTTPARAQCPVRSSSTTRGPPLSPCTRRGSLEQRSLEVTRGHLAGVPQEAAGPGPAVPLAPGTQQPRVLRAGDQVWVAGHGGHGDVVTLSRVLQYSTVQYSTVQYSTWSGVTSPRTPPGSAPPRWSTAAGWRWGRLGASLHHHCVLLTTDLGRCGPSQTPRQSPQPQTGTWAAAARTRTRPRGLSRYI